MILSGPRVWFRRHSRSILKVCFKLNTFYKSFTNTVFGISVYGRGEDDVLSWENSMLDETDNLIMKTENMTDEECLDDDQYTDSDIE